MKISLVTFDDFTDVDLFLTWDLLNRVQHPEWSVSIIGEKSSHVSTAGLRVETQGPLSEANDSDVVLITSGKGTRLKIYDAAFLGTLRLDPARQMIGSQCSGALILARLGLLDGISATTHRIAQRELRALGVDVVNSPFVAVGNVATAGGCLAAQYLVGWILERTLGVEVRKRVLASVAPVGQEDDYEQRVTDVLHGALAPRDRRGAQRELSG